MTVRCEPEYSRRDAPRPWEETLGFRAKYTGEGPRGADHGDLRSRP